MPHLRGKHTLSIDVEEYFHAANLSDVAPPRIWRRLPHRVEESTEKVLDLFDRCNAKATFFVLGYVAARNPRIVREIAARGHEVASHGYAHRLAYEQNERQFRRDIHRSKRLLEDLVGVPVFGYRAPNFSIRDGNQWAYDTLIAEGYRYDSSVYPVWHPRYANLSAPTQPFVIRRDSGSILEFPLATAEISLFGRNIRFPAAGGAYWRLLPLCYTRWALNRILRAGNSLHCYLHPWEIDPEQPVFVELSFNTQFRHYGRIASFESQVESLLRLFPAVPFREIVGNVSSDHDTPGCDAGVVSP